MKDVLLELKELKLQLMELEAYLSFLKDAGFIEYECTEEFIEKLIEEGKIKAGDEDNV